MARENRDTLSFERGRRWALIVFVVGGFACAIGYFVAPSRFFQSYLLAFVYWWTTAMGCLGLALLNQMTGGRWGYAARPFYDAGIRTLPLLAIAFIPLAWGLEGIYAWTADDYFAGDPHALNRQWWLSDGFFLGRSAAYLLLAAGIGFLLTFRSVDRERNRQRTNLWPVGGGLGAVAATLVATFAMFDWGMSLDPEWYSTLYASIYIAGGLLCAVCLVTGGVALAVARLGRGDPTTQTILHDLGKLILAFLMVWAYLAFSQFLIIYAGNLPLEAVYYTDRLEGGWEAVGIALVVLHFVIPFLCLLSRDLKQNTHRLATVALALGAVHWLDIYWTIIPSFHPGSWSLHWLDLAIPLALGGLLAFEYLRQLQQRLDPVLDVWPHEQALAAPSGATAHD